MSKEGSTNGRKKSKKAKVGVLNTSFEMDEAKYTAKEKVKPFLNNIRDNLAKINKNVHLEAIVGAKKTVSRWKDFCNERRIRKKNRVLTGQADQDGEDRIMGSLGLDDVHEKHIHQPIFGEKQSVQKTMTSAMNRSMIQYFAKLGRSKKDDEVVDLDYVEQMLSNGANINCADKHGQTVLHEVASKWHIDVAQFLLEHGADPNKTDLYGRCPLHVAAADDYPDMVKLLIEKGANKEARTTGELQTPVHYAAKNDASSALKMLIKMKCEYREVVDYKGRTPLHVAAELDRSETARQLLELEAPAWMSDNKGQATMTWLITKMPPVAMEALNQFHSTDRPNRDQYFYLNYLVRDREKDKDDQTQTPLSVAVKYKLFDLLKHQVFLTLIKIMWNKFAWWRAILSLIFNFVYIMLWTIYGCLIEYDKRHLYVLPEQWWRIVLLCAAVGITIWQIVEEVREFRRSNQSHEAWKAWRNQEIEEDLKYCHPRWPEEEDFLRKEQNSLEKSHTKYWKDPWNIFDWWCYCFLAVVIITHIVDVAAHSDALARAHIRLTAVTVIFLWLRLMKNIRAFATLGPFIVMLGNMLADVVKFCFLYLQFFIPFVCAYWMIFGGNKYPADSVGDPNRTEVTIDEFITFGETLFTLYRMTLVDEYPLPTMLTVDNVMTYILVVSWLALSAILCLNLFIALLSDTFQRVYDNAQANAVMQKAITILNFWDGMSPAAQDKFLNYIRDNCSPYKEFYDDDMTEEGGEDLKKATLQLKDQMDDLMEKWHDQFGTGDEEKSALNFEPFRNQLWKEQLQEEEEVAPAPKKGTPGGKMVTTTTFTSSIQTLRTELRTEISQIQAQQTQMMDKFKRDLKVIKTLLLDLSSQGGPPRHTPGAGGFGGGMGTAFMATDEGSMYPGSGSQSRQGDGYSAEGSTPRVHKSAPRKKKKSSLASDSLIEPPLPGEVYMRGPVQGGLFAPSPAVGQSVLEVSTQDYMPVDGLQTAIVQPDMSTVEHDADHSVA